MTRVEQRTEPEQTGGTEPTAPLVGFAIEGQRYALRLAAVQRVVRAVAVTPLPGAPPIVLGIIDCGGSVLPVIDLRARFGHPARALRLSDQLLIATTPRRKVALLVEAATGVLAGRPETWVARGEILPGLALVAGAVKLEDGLVLVHDLERLLSLDEEEAIDRAMAALPGRRIQDPARTSAVAGGAVEGRG